MELNKSGFVALAFDPSFNGYSSGMPRHISSPDFSQRISVQQWILSEHALLLTGIRLVQSVSAAAAVSF